MRIPIKVAVCGFSAGGHLAAMQGVHWNDPELMRLSGCVNGENRPDALILAYPVITSGKYAHTDSIANLLNRFRKAGKPEELERMLDFVSCEKHVGPHTPPVFLFHTRLDSGVSVCNSLLFAEALAENGIVLKCIFRTGGSMACHEQPYHGSYGSRACKRGRGSMDETEL